MTCKLEEEVPKGHAMVRESKKARATRARTVKGVPTCLSLFTGAGGLDLGFERAGFRILAATDIEPCSLKTVARNWPGTPFVLADAQTLAVESLVDAMGGLRPDVIIGGPPCQGFSTLGDRHSADHRNLLVDEFVRITEILRPQAVLVENVRAITTEYGGRYRDYVIEHFGAIGYRMQSAVLNAAEFGVPQLRSRAFFVGFADPRVRYQWPVPTHGDGLLPYRTVGDAIGDLVDAGREVANHIPLRHTERVVRRYQLIPEGGLLPPPEDLPEDLRRKNFGSTYKRLHRDRPSLTLVPGNNAFPVHPVLDRSLTPREAARLQTFPDDFVFEGDRRRQCILVGNAVPPVLATALAESVREKILPRRGSQARFKRKRKASGVEVVLKRPRLVSGKQGAEGFVDLFSGAGGIGLGLMNAGLRPLVFADMSDDVRATHEFNTPEIPFVHGDLRLPEVQEAVAAISGKEPFAVVGGPPCQGFSVFGKRRLRSVSDADAELDTRNRLVLSFVDAVGLMRPRWVLMENVAGFVSMARGAYLCQVVEELGQLGYCTIEYRILDAVDYGVPQRRKRFVLIANRTGHVIPWPKRKFFDNPRDWQMGFRTVGEAIADLAEEESYSRFTCHVPMRHRPLTVARYRHIPEGERIDVEALPTELRRGYRTRTVGNFSHVFKRLHRDKPSLTLVPGHNAFPVHPWLDRSLTVREAARLQTFPDSSSSAGHVRASAYRLETHFPLCYPG